jgi:hypothetical protein
VACGGAFEWAACDAIMLAGGGRAATDAPRLPTYLSPCDASGRKCLQEGRRMLVRASRVFREGRFESLLKELVFIYFPSREQC